MIKAKNGIYAKAGNAVFFWNYRNICIVRRKTGLDQYETKEFNNLFEALAYCYEGSQSQDIRELRTILEATGKDQYNGFIGDL